MKRFLMGLLVGFILGTVVSVAVASNISGEALWNKVFDSTNNKINVIGV